MQAFWLQACLYLFPVWCPRLQLRYGCASQHLFPPTILQMPLQRTPQPWFCHTFHFVKTWGWLRQVMPAVELGQDQGVCADLGSNPGFLRTKKALGQMPQYQNFCLWPTTTLALGYHFYFLFPPCFLSRPRRVTLSTPQCALSKPAGPGPPTTPSWSVLGMSTKCPCCTLGSGERSGIPAGYPAHSPNLGAHRGSRAPLSLGTASVTKDAESNTKYSPNRGFVFSKLSI